MQLVYFSKTGNVSRFINKLNQNFFPTIKGGDFISETPVILVTYTTGYGEIPSEVKTFCERNNHNIKFVIASGNRNWGEMFARSGDLIATQFDAKMLYKFELSGTNKDVNYVSNILKQIYENKQV